MSVTAGREAGKPIPVREPVLEVPDSIDLGRVIRGRPHPFDLDIHNRGGKALDVEVSSAVPDMRIAPRKFQVPPSSSGRVEVEFTPNGNHGNALASVTVQSDNSCVDPEQVVTVRGTVIDEVILTSDPPAIQLSPPLLANAEPTRISLKITRDDGAKARLERCDLEADDIVQKSVICKISHSDSDQAEVEVHTANRAAGRYAGTLHLYEEDPLVAPLAIPIDFSVMASAQVALLSPRLAIVDAGGTAQLRVQNAGSRSISARVCCHIAGVQVGHQDQAIVLGPGEETLLPLSYRFHAVPEHDTPIELEFWVSDAEAASAPLTLQLEKVTLAPLDVQPQLELLTKRSMAVGRKSNFRVRVANPGDSPVTVTAQKCSMTGTWGSTPVTVRPHGSGTLYGFVTPSGNSLGPQKLDLSLLWQTPETQGVVPIATAINVAKSTSGPRWGVWLGLGLLSLVLVGWMLYLVHGQPPQPTPPKSGSGITLEPSSPPPLAPILEQAWRLHQDGQNGQVIDLLLSHRADFQTSKYFAEEQMLLGWSYADTGNDNDARLAFRNYWQCAPENDTHRLPVRDALSRLQVAPQELPSVVGNCAPTLSWQTDIPRSSE